MPVSPPSPCSSIEKLTDVWTVGADKGLTSPAIEEWRSRVAREFMRLVRVPNERLGWLTIIGKPIIVRPGDHSAEVLAAVEKLEAEIRTRIRRRMPGLRMMAIHEIDVLTGSKNMGSHKLDLLRELGVDPAQLCSGERVLLIHIHAVIDVASYRPVFVRDQFQGSFKGSRRVMLKGLFTHRSIRHNLERLAGYSTKLKVAYCDAWGDRKTKFGSLFETVWQDTIQQTLRSITLNRLVFFHGVSASSFRSDGAQSPISTVDLENGGHARVSPPKRPLGKQTVRPVRQLERLPAFRKDGLAKSACSSEPMQTPKVRPSGRSPPGLVPHWCLEFLDG